MALFKVYRGETLPSDAHAGYGYVSIGAAATVGTWYVDVDTSTTITGNRFPIAAPGLVHQGTYYELPAIKQEIKTEIDAPEKAHSVDVYVNSTSGWTLLEDNYVKTVTISDDITGNAPPIITFKSGSLDFYSAIKKVEVDKSNNSLTFYIPQSLSPYIVSNMTVTMVDYG